MARKVRLFFEGTAHHILLRGVNQEKIFVDADDFAYGVAVLKELCETLLVQLHAYVLMPNHLHLLCTPLEKEALSRFMQGFGIKYVAYFNKKYDRSGTLWEGRYRSSLVEERFILPLMCYIEANPKRSNLVASESEYPYSSFTCNALARSQAPWLTPHRLYTLLAANDEERARIYATVCAKEMPETILAFIREHIVKQTPTGTPAFYKELSERIGAGIITKKVGRPRKPNPSHRSDTMYQNIVVLDKEKHKNLKINPLSQLGFAKQLASTPLLANEAMMVGKDFPIVFTGGEKTTLVALTSLGGENLAINAEGKYIVPYVPAFLRRYPFSLGANKENPEQQLILIDEGSELFSASKGKQLFTKEGKPSETLENAITFLKNYEAERLKTQAIVQEIASSGILEEREISVGEGEDKKVLVNGFKVINREKLHALDDARLANWVRRGVIGFIDAHLGSLSHIQTLFNLASTQQK